MPRQKESGLALAVVHLVLMLEMGGQEVPQVVAVIRAESEAIQPMEEMGLQVRMERLAKEEQ